MKSHKWRSIRRTEQQHLSGEVTRRYECTVCGVKIISIWYDMHGNVQKKPQALFETIIEDCNLSLINKINKL